VLHDGPLSYIAENFMPPERGGVDGGQALEYAVANMYREYDI